MLKRLMAVFCAANMMLGASVCAWAAEGKPTGEKVEISFKVGDSTLKINKEDVTVQKPYVVDGVTLVPVRVITEAFGAEVEWNGATQEIDILYSDVKIQLSIGKKEAYVNNSRIELLAAPALVEDTTMLPLRFITENFGADVSYDNTDGAILVEKEITESDSIMDYAMILKRSNKQKAGDAYLGWSIDRSPKFKLVERSFDGHYNGFYDESRSAYITVVIRLHKDSTADSLLEDCRNAIQDMTVNRLDKAVAADGTPYMFAQYKDANCYYYDKVFIKGDKLYSVYAQMSTETDKKEFEDIIALADSFALNFNESTTENLSDVKPETDMHIYRSKTMGIEMDIPGAYLSLESEDKDNEAAFVQYNNMQDRADFDLIHISMYSVQDGKDYRAWAENDLRHNIEDTNPDFADFGEIQEVTLDGKKAAFYDYEVKYGDQVNFTRDLFIDAGEYFYNIAVSLLNHENAQAETEKILNTVKFTDFDKDELGIMIRTNVDEIAYKTYKNENMGVAFEAPTTWQEIKDAGNIAVVSPEGNRTIMVSSASKAGTEQVPSLKDIADRVMQNAKTNKLVTIDPAGLQTVKINNQTAYWYKASVKGEGTSSVSVIYNYICDAGDAFIMASFQIDERADGMRAKTIREKFLNTLKFE